MKRVQLVRLKFQLGSMFCSVHPMLEMVRMTGRWSLPPSCVLTVLEVSRCTSSVAMARSGVEQVFHALE